MQPLGVLETWPFERVTDQAGCPPANDSTTAPLPNLLEPFPVAATRSPCAPHVAPFLTPIISSPLPSMANPQSPHQLGSPLPRIDNSIGQFSPLHALPTPSQLHSSSGLPTASSPSPPLTPAEIAASCLVSFSMSPTVMTDLVSQGSPVSASTPTTPSTPSEIPPSSSAQSSFRTESRSDDSTDRSSRGAYRKATSYRGNDSSVDDETTASTTSTHRFRCPFPRCGRAFQSRANLEQHRRTHTGERPFHCDYPGCGLAFGREYTLKCHRFTHSKEKPFKCEEEGCNKSYSQHAALIIHQRSHTGERPFVCSEPGCGKRFVTKHKVERHVQGCHRLEKPHACPVDGCSWSFTERSALRKHLTTHDSAVANDYKCPKCGQTYRQKTSLTRHLARHASEQLTLPTTFITSSS